MSAACRDRSHPVQAGPDDGRPRLVYVLQGVFFISSLIQLIYFLSAGLVRAVRRKPDSSDAKCRPDSRDTRLRPDSGDSNRKPDKAEGR